MTMAMPWPPPPHMLSTPPGRAAAAQGLAGSGNLLIGAITAYSAGSMYEHWGSEWMFTAAGSGVVVFALLSLWQSRVGSDRSAASATHSA